MGFYVLLFVISVSLLVLSKKKIAFIVSFTMLWAVYALRDQVAVDDGSYIEAFDYISIGWNFDIEYSYKLLVRLANLIGMNYKFVFLIYATLSFVLLYKAINLMYSTNWAKALYLSSFYGIAFFTSMSVMRQFLSSILCFYAVVYFYYKSKKMIPVFLTLLAVFFHGGSIIAIPLLCIFHPKVKITYLTKITLVLSCVCFGYLGIANVLLQSIIGFLPQSYGIYSESLEGSFSSVGGTLSWVLLVMFLSQCMISVYKSKQKIIQNNSTLMQDAMEKGQLIYLCLLFFFVEAGVASRLAFTYMPFIAALPMTFTMRIQRNERTMVKSVAIFSMFILFMMTLINSADISPGFFIPYRSSLDFLN